MSTELHNDAALNIRLPKSTLEALQARQRATLVPTSAWVRSLIEQALRPIEHHAKRWEPFIERMGNDRKTCLLVADVPKAEQTAEQDRTTTE